MTPAAAAECPHTAKTLPNDAGRAKKRRETRPREACFIPKSFGVPGAVLGDEVQVEAGGGRASQRRTAGALCAA